MMRRRSTVMIAILMVGVASLAVSPAGRAQEPQVTASILLMTPPERRQGVAFNFEALVSNSSGDSVETAIAFQLDPPGDLPPAVFDVWTGAVDGYSERRLKSGVIPSQWFPDLGAYKIFLTGQGVEPTGSVEIHVTPAKVTVPVFEDVTEWSGVDTIHQTDTFCIGGSYIAGAAWADVEGDGDLDLYVPRPKASAHLFVNHEGSFVDRAAPAGVNNGGSVGIGAVFADYDNDGDPDLYVVNEDQNRLYQNDGAGRFKDVGPEAGVNSPTPDAAAAWGDYDNDGYLDLYVANWGKRCESPSAPRSWTYYADHLYHNNGDGTFTDVVDLLHVDGSTMGAGLQASWFDYDLDGDVDLYLGNDYIGPQAEPNFLWRNDGMGPDGEWRFRNVSSESGAGVAMHSMGIGIGDYDRDFDLDLAISNIRPTVLLRNRGDGTFVDRAKRARVDRPIQSSGNKAITWAAEFKDFNNDGWEDLYVAAGELDRPLYEPNEMFVNARNGRFLDLSAASYTNDLGISRGVAVADYDGDGWLDMYVVNWRGKPKLYRNTTSSRNHWLEVDTVGRKSNRDGCGAILIAKIKKERQLRQVFCGSTSVGSGSDSVVHFGLGAARRVTKLIVKWPSGRRTVKRDLKVNRLIVVKEPRR